MFFFGRQIIHIFSQYDSILRRPSVMSLLTAERELFFQSINDFIKEIKASLHQKTSFQSNVNLSPICWECRWLRVVLHQVGVMKCRIVEPRVENSRSAESIVFPFPFVFYSDK